MKILKKIPPIITVICYVATALVLITMLLTFDLYGWGEVANLADKLSIAAQGNFMDMSVTTLLSIAGLALLIGISSLGMILLYLTTLTILIMLITVVCRLIIALKRGYKKAEILDYALEIVKDFIQA